MGLTVRRSVSPGIGVVALVTACHASAPTITVQPSDARVFEGQSALFEVVTAETDNITYQWSRNGQAIPGATAARLVTAATTPEDDGATYLVVATRDGADVTSRPARLAVDPPLDLRFKWVEAPYQPEWFVDRVFSAGEGRALDGSGIAGVVSVESCGVGSCEWTFVWASSTNGMRMRFEISSLANLTPGFAGARGPDALITALDVQEPVGLYAMSVSRTTQLGDFTPALDGAVPLADLPALAASEGSLGRVITAVSSRGGLASYASYGWSLAPAAVYETRVVVATLDGLPAAAWALADDGFVITAAGSGDRAAGEYVLVGTRAQGDTLSRSIVLGHGVVGYRDYAPVARFEADRYVAVGER